MKGDVRDVREATREEIAAEVMAELRKDFEARHELFWATLSELKKEVAHSSD